MDRNEVLVTMQELSVEVLGVEASQVTEGARFFADLDADSLDVVELVMAIEERLDVTIPEDELDEINTVGDAITAVLDKLAARTG